MAHDLQSSSNRRKRKWRAKWKEIHRLEKIAERDRRRVEKGLLPLADANREKVKKFREKQARMKDFVAECWFGPDIDMEAAIHQRIAASPNLDSSLVRSLVEGCARNCRGSSLNLNAFTLEHGAHRANHARTVLHELLESGVPLSEAATRCHKEAFKPNLSLLGVQQALDTCRRFDDARDKWGDGSEIVAALLGKSAV